MPGPLEILNHRCNHLHVDGSYAWQQSGALVQPTITDQHLAPLVVGRAGRHCKIQLHVLFSLHTMEQCVCGYCAWPLACLSSLKPYQPIVSKPAFPMPLLAQSSVQHTISQHTSVYATPPAQCSTHTYRSNLCLRVTATHVSA